MERSEYLANLALASKLNAEYMVDRRTHSTAGRNWSEPSKHVYRPAARRSTNVVVRILRKIWSLL